MMTLSRLRGHHGRWGRKMKEPEAVDDYNQTVFSRLTPAMCCHAQNLSKIKADGNPAWRRQGHIKPHPELRSTWRSKAAESESASSRTHLLVAGSTLSQALAALSGFKKKVHEMEQEWWSGQGGVGVILGEGIDQNIGYEKQNKTKELVEHT